MCLGRRWWRGLCVSRRHGGGAQREVRGAGQAASQLEADLVVPGVDVVEGEADDAADGLGEQEHEQPGDAVLGFDGGVVQQPAGLPPAGLGVDDSGWAAPLDGREVQSGQLLSSGPADEVPGRVLMSGMWAGQPFLQVTLAGGGEGEPVFGEPVEQDDGSADVTSRGCGLAAGGVSTGEPSTQSPDHVPDGVAVQQLPLLGVRSLRDDLGDPALQPGHVLVAGLQRADGDQDAAQVLDRFAVGHLVEGGVGELFAGRFQAAQDGRGCAVEPGGHVLARSVAARASCKTCRCGWMRPVSSPRISRSRCWTVQRAHRQERMRPGCPQLGQLCQNSGRRGCRKRKVAG